MFYIVYGSLYALSLLPMWLLYLLSDAVYILLYRIIGYRKEVVRNNLQIAFPEKSLEEIKQIEKKFYRNFTDNFIETLKLISGGNKFALEHFSADASRMEELYKQGKRCQVHLGHNFNWELGNLAITPLVSYDMLLVYMPVKNKVFDRIMYKLRTSSGNNMLPATDMKNAMIPYRNSQYMLVLVADQVPGDASRAYWLNFFGRPTPFIKGPERGAVAGNLAVFFGQFYKTKRGHYKYEYELATENAGELQKGELTKMYVRYLEKVIRQHPEMWLWSHRRWKKEWREEYRDLWIDDIPPFEAVTKGNDA